MNPTDVPVKTAAGHRELAERRHKLSPRVRSLLIVVHGTDSVGELARTLHAFGEIDAGLNALLRLGLIELKPRTAAAPVAEAKPAAMQIDAAVPPAQQAKQLLNQSAVAVLGLRAFLFTLKLEHCYTADELRGIVPEYRRVVGKARGDAFAGAMVRRVEALLARA